MFIAGSMLTLGKLFFHSVSRLNLVALKASACCSTVSLTWGPWWALHQTPGFTAASVIELYRA